MKVVIIGGGIAGLTLGASLNKKDMEVVINERSVGMPIHGHAFLMHLDGLSILNQLRENEKEAFQGKVVDTFRLKRPEGKEIKHLRLSNWQCFKRCDVIRFLYSLDKKGIIKEGREFSHFIYESEKVVAAAFLNGDVEYGDIFIGADGGNSKVREAIFGKVKTNPVRVKEVVGVSHNEQVVKKYSSIFTKFQHETKGLAFGFIPTSETEFVWFMQYDPAESDLTVNTPTVLEAFCKRQLLNFPPVVAEILETNDFSTSYIWNTRDFDLLSSFHHENVALIGDAAHLTLPFSSAGTTNAISDAKVLADCIENSGDYKKAFENYYQLRAEQISQHINLGRELQKLFLTPQLHSDDDIPVPLISKKSVNGAAKRKEIEVTYFTDPICSTCWIIQPLLRRLNLEYGKYLNVEYRMGGLLPSWEDYNKGKISNPSDAAKHWEEVCSFYEMPLDGDVWIEDPLASSYPPSIAFKAAQIQDTNTAILFLRRIKEMVFLEKKNIIRWDFLQKAAFEVGLDSARLLRDVEGKAKDLFRDDLILASKLGVTGFPTLFFSDGTGKRFTIKGYQPYEKFEEIIFKLAPGARKEEINTTPKNLFTHFPTMTEKEFSFLSNNTKEYASKILVELFENGSIEKYESKNGIIWKNKYATW
ncbi:MAG: hypothetical protein JWQ40_1481 [Segetibacter sp.]|nr:hypothetical protein [Segetibacter sp.]